MTIYSPYNIELGKMSSLALNGVIYLCTQHFGHQGNRWDYTARRMSPMWKFNNVKFYFKTQEDLVLFKLAYELEYQ